MARLWISTDELLERTPSLSSLVRQAKGEPEPKTANIRKGGTGSVSASEPQQGSASAKKSLAAPVDDRPAPTPAESAKMRAEKAANAAARAATLAGPAAKNHAFDHSEEKPTLSERTRADLGKAHERHEAFHAGYHDEKGKLAQVRHLQGRSANQNFHGSMVGGHSFISKPHASAADDHEPEHWGARHEATYSLAAMMGAGHMALPGFESKFHGHDQIPDKVPHPDERDLAHEPEPGEKNQTPKRLTMPRFHAGNPTHVVQHEPNHVTVGDATDEQLAGVDHEHRLHGMVMHLLQSNGDGHEDNVMIHGSGHPILIDHDLGFASENTKGLRQKHEKTAIRSVFSPGGKLDFTKTAPKGEDGKPTPVGKNFPERMKKTLEFLALGGHSEEGEHNMGLSPDDAKELMNNARDLLKHGLEGTIERRHKIMENV